MADVPPPATSPAETPPPRTTGGNWRWEPPTAAELQALMPGYTIEKLLGRGGMGAVYRGVQMNLDRPAAIKILPPGVEREDPSFAERFKSEARLMAKLNHPAVVSVYDFGTTSAGQLYFAMEYVDGSDVSQMIAAQGRLPPEHALAITAHVCDALSAAHELGIVHRDIKPANVLLNMKGQVKVADFGLAKVEEPGQHGLTKTGYAMGTPDFVAPEALTLGAAIDGRADLYAVGVMLYQMLTGNIPRGAFKPASVLVPSIDPRFDPIILKAMQHDRAERHQSAADLRRELDVILTVPLVQQNAPASAAIPIAEMAQSPGQRSAAQKPVGKPPQPKGTHGTPARQEAAAKDRIVPARSKMPLFLGLGAGTAIIIGTFMMMGGKKPDATQPTKTVAPAPPPTKPLASEIRTAPPPAAAAKLDQSKFEPGKWTPLKGMLTTAHVASSGANVTPEGVLKLAGKSVVLPGLKVRDIAVRASVKRPAGVVGLGLSVRCFEQASHTLNFGATRSSLVVTTDGKDSKISSFLPHNADLGTTIPVRLELAAVGRRTFGAVNGTHCEIFDAAEVPGAGLVRLSCVSNEAEFSNIELMMLDGVSEDKWPAFVKESSRDKKDVVATSSPAISAAPASVIPPAPVSFDKFPPGQWVKIDWTTAKLKFSKIHDGTLIVPAEKQESLPIPECRNIAVRVKAKRADDIPHGLALTIRKKDSDHYALGTVVPEEPPRGAINLRFGADTSKWIQVRGPCETMAAGKESVYEFAGVGSRFFWRIDGAIIANHADEHVSEASGVSLFSGRGNVEFRDIEVMNLDGLSEAEALRILGVDEKGNDLRATAVAQEKQAVEQAKVMDAASAIPELKALHEQFVKLTAERVTAPFTADLAKLNAGYIGGIDRKIAEETAAGHLDGILALEAEKKLLGNKQPIPAEDAEDTTANLKALRAIYRAAYAKIEAARLTNLKQLIDPLTLRLKTLETELTKQKRVPDAKTVREYRENLGKEGDAVIPDRNSIVGGTSSKINEADTNTRPPLKKFQNGDDRKAAEWVLTAGGTIKIHDGRNELTLNTRDALPQRSFVIREIDLKPSTGMIDNLAPIARLPELRKISATGRQITDADTDVLASFPQLTTIDFSYTTNFTGAELAKLKKRNVLKEISAGAAMLTGEGLKQIGEISSICRLNLGKCNVTDEDVASLRTLKNLYSLRLHFTKVTLEGWKKVRDLPLTAIGFHNEPGKVAALCKELSALFPQISFIEFTANSPLTSEDVTSLVAFRRLNGLTFASSQINNASIKAVTGLGQLETLMLSSLDGPNTALTDDGMAALLEMKALQRLTIEKLNGISPATLVTLARHKPLQFLKISNCSQLDDTAIATFKKARPDVTVTK